jgi:hypothetical protein
VAAFIGAVQARDDGRYSLSPLKPWFDGLRSGKGPCCSDADGFALSDPDWESKSGHRTGQDDGLADQGNSRDLHSLLRAGQHDMISTPSISATSEGAISCRRYFDIGQRRTRHRTIQVLERVDQWRKSHV